MEKLRSLVKEAVAGCSGGKDDVLGFILKLAAGRFEHPPFPTKHLDELRGWLVDHLDLDKGDLRIASGQAMHLKLISELLRAFGDPDWKYIADLEEGVDIGVGVVMPRTPAVFEEKVKWSLDEPDGNEQNDSENYGTVEDHKTEVENYSG